MIVRELIEKLLQMPMDAVVIHDMCSDYALLPEPTLYKAEDETVCYRNGHYTTMTRRQFPPDEQPVFVTAVHFYGN